MAKRYERCKPVYKKDTSELNLNLTFPSRLRRRITVVDTKRACLERFKRGSRPLKPVSISNAAPQTGTVGPCKDPWTK